MTYISMPTKAIAEHKKAFTSVIKSSLEKLLNETPDDKLKQYYGFLLRAHCETNFAIARPMTLQGIIDRSEEKIKELGFDARRVRGRDSALFKHVDYRLFSPQKSAGWNTHSFVDLLKVDVCPYCNVCSIRPSPGYPDLDHYFPRSRFPFLGLSLFNLIPVCKTCNGQSHKGQNYLPWRECAHPYTDDMHGQIAFKDKFKSLKKWFECMPDGDMPLELDAVDSCVDSYARNFITKIKILTKYKEGHKSEIEDIVSRIHHYTDELSRAGEENFPGITGYNHPLFFADQYLDKKDILKVPFSKLKLDLCRQYGICSPNAS